MSLRLRVALSLAAIAVVSAVAIGTVSYRTTSERLIDEIDRSLAKAERDVRPQGGPGDPLPERGPLSGIDAQIVSADGSVIDSTFPTELPVSDADLSLMDGRGGSRYATVETDDRTYRVRTVAFADGAIQVGRDLDEVDRVLSSLRWRIAFWAVAVGAFASALGWWIASHITASLRRLTGAAEHVEATGRLDVSVAVDGSDEVGRLAAAFDRMLAALARSKDEQRRLVQDAGHELRTPLTSLRTNVDALERYPDMSRDDRDAVLADLRSETDELTELVNEIVAVASGELSDEPFVDVDLGALVGEVADRYERRTGRSIAVTTIPTAGSNHVGVQRASVQRAVSCLLDNARKFDPSGAPIEVTVAEATVVVADRGPGIPPADLDRIFERFYRADEARTLPGSGLGLSIVDAVAARHDGETFARARDGGGAEVGFRLGAAAGDR